MKYFEIAAALLLCGSAHAATYVYQANAYQGHEGRCGGDLLPFQVTMTLKRPLPPSSTLDNVSIRALAVSAGGNYQWSQRFNKVHSHQARFSTDANGTIITWVLGDSRSAREFFGTENDTEEVKDSIEFKCGGAGGSGDPGVWTRTE
jgi:hypothetical protein